MAYTINGNSFSIYDMQILSCAGALDIPARKGDVEYNWGDSNGIEAFTDSDDLNWDGRDIVLSAYYSGSNLISQVDSFLSTYRGIDITLVTTFGTYSVRLVGMKTDKNYKPNTKTLITIHFWQNTVTPGTPPSATGGTGTRIGGYDLYNDFNLYVRLVHGFVDVKYDQKKLTYGDSPLQYSQYRNNRKVHIELNGAYSSVANMISNLEKLRDVLMSSGEKTLIYKSVSKTVYFADKVKIETDVKRKIARMTLTLRIVE